MGGQGWLEAELLAVGWGGFGKSGEGMFSPSSKSALIQSYQPDYRPDYQLRAGSSNFEVSAW